MEAREYENESWYKNMTSEKNRRGIEAFWTKVDEKRMKKIMTKKYDIELPEE